MRNTDSLIERRCIYNWICVSRKKERDAGVQNGEHGSRTKSPPSPTAPIPNTDAGWNLLRFTYAGSRPKQGREKKSHLFLTNANLLCESFHHVKFFEWIESRIPPKLLNNERIRRATFGTSPHFRHGDNWTDEYGGL